MEHVDELLGSLAEGSLNEGDHRMVAEHVRGCQRCSALVEAVTRELDVLESLPETPDAIGAELTDRIRSTERFAPFTQDFAELFDLPEDVASRTLVELAGAPRWDEGPVPGIGMVPVRAGPARAHALAVVTRLPPGVVYPAHEHLGQETVLVLQGAYVDSPSGHRVDQGQRKVYPAGSSHAFEAADGVACICATVLELS